MWGWTLMGVGLIALLGLCLTSGDLRDRFIGSGDRRISRRRRLAQQRDEIAAMRQQIEACPHCTPPEIPTDEQLTIADLLAGPGVNVPAPADDPMSCFAQPDPKPVAEEELRVVADTPVVAETYEPADPNAQTQPTNVAALRNAMGMGRTAQFPAVSKVEAPRPQQVPAGPGSANPTEVSPQTGKRATVRVATALDEAS